MDSSDIWFAFRAGTTQDRAGAWRSACLEVLRLSGLFDPATYLTRYGSVGAGVDPLAQYHDEGWRAGRWPNPYFDPDWYRAEYPDVAASGADPLLHYVSYGEGEGRRPVAWFDPVWYRAHHQVPPGLHALRHFLLHRHQGSVRPIAEFDSAWYLATYPDVAAAGMDPVEHYLVQGFREGRNPSAGFDTRFYRLRYLRGQPDTVPLLHYLAHRGQPGVHARCPPDEASIGGELRRFAAAGPAFETLRAAPPGAEPRALALAFYLPQFHPIAQNDSWWGEGFTEWTNVARGMPRFAGHYQPRIPRDLGHYRLDDPDVLLRQIALARGAGIGGFVFYFYWFDGQRLLERPVEQYLADRRETFPFCLMWANENWTRRWDGSDSEVLIAQSYARADEAALIATFARHFADPRYIRLQGRPLLMIYRPGLIPDPVATIARWRARFRAAHGEEPLLVMAQSFDDDDPRKFGLDGAVQFPPHKLVHGLSLINHRLELLDHAFDAQVYAYDEAVAAACAAPPADFPLIRSAMPGWDNDARRQGRGMVMHGATPARYRQWLDHLVAGAQAAPFAGTPIVCINAWNEWAEGAYLEPDQHFGAAFLNATGQALFGIPCESADDAIGNRLVLVGHDAFAAGAQLLLLHLAQRLRADHGMVLEILLCGEGALLEAYAAVAPVTIVSDGGALAAAIARMRAAGFGRALVNSAAASHCCAALAAGGFAVSLMVHEMPGLLAERGLLAPLAAACACVARVIYPAVTVRAAVEQALGGGTNGVILPQGLYQAPVAQPLAAAALRAQWGVAEAPLVVGLGHGDRRKGFDLFVALFEQSTRPDLHMAWVGSVDPGLRAALGPRIAAAEATGRFRLAGWREDVAAVLTAADLLALTSREDPYPSAALEALSLGTRVVAFAGSGGVADLLAGGAGLVVPAGDVGAMAAVADEVVRVVIRPGAGPVVFEADFGVYVAALLRLVRGVGDVSVIVTSYRHAGLIERRLASVFDQTEPVREVLLRDDASGDQGPELAAQVAAARVRSLGVLVAARNSGSPFGQWAKAVAEARGELVWIAEADDVASPGFLAGLLPFFADPAVVLAFADSAPVDAAGNPLGEDYRASYQAAGGAGALGEDAVYEADVFVRRFLCERNILFNVSAVVWRRTALLGALERLGPALSDYRVGGDWRLYIELLAGQAGRVGHKASVLNAHCRGTQTASARLPAARHLAEIRRIHRLLRGLLGDPPGLAARQRRMLAEASRYLQRCELVPPRG
jgi:glycosyltransferase involved in cell wall biosynthesis